MIDWKALLAYITGSVDQELLLRNAYLATENRILRNQIQGRVRLSNGERKTLAEIGKQSSKQALAEVATVVTPDTILAWHRKLVAKKFDGSPQRQAPGRPKIDQALEDLVVRMAQKNRSWGYDRIVGALHYLGYTISDQTVQYSQASRHSPSTGAEEDHHVEGVYPHHGERPHQGKGNVVLMPVADPPPNACWPSALSGAARWAAKIL
jgi:hypothetical protein